LSARRLVDPWTLVLILACVGVTGQTLFFGKDIVEAGAASRHLLWEGDLWRIAAAILLHGGWVHLLVNCMGLFFVGPVIARGVGGPVYYATLFFSAFAGLAASLLFHSPITYLVGISGGVLGLIGLILAIEWHNAQGSWMAFFRARNTKVIVILIVINAILAVVIERVWTTVQLDHAAHLGGLFFGLFFGLALFGRSGHRPRAAAITTLLLSIAPLTYAAWPQWDKTQVKHLIARAEMAWRLKDQSKARRLYAFALELDPGHPVIGANLALLDDDPKWLAGLREPSGDQEKKPAIYARLELARRRLQSDPKTAELLVDEATLIQLADNPWWLKFAAEAQSKGQPAIAYKAYLAAARDLPPSRKWRGARWVLGPLLARIGRAEGKEKLPLALEAADQARLAVGGLGESSGLPPDEHATYERAIHAALTALTKLADLFVWRELSARLSEAWHDFGENIGSNDDDPHPRRAQAFYEAARTAWRVIEGLVSRKKDLPSVAGRYKTALAEALENEAPDIAEAARAWFLARGLPIPKVADPRGGG